MGHEQFNKEITSLCSEIIKEKCKTRYMMPAYTLYVCDFDNWVVKKIDSHGGKNHIKKILFENGFNVCLKRDATHYVEVTKKNEERSLFHFWLHPIIN